MTLILTELKKLKRNKMIFGIFIVTTVFAAFAVQRAFGMGRDSPSMDSFGDLYTLAFKNLATILLPIALAIFTTALFFEEYRNKTIKELLVIPVSKEKLFFSKLAVTILVSLSLCLFTFAVSVVGGILAGGFTDINTSSILQAFVLYFAGGLLIPIAMIPITFLSTVSKGYVLPIGVSLIYLAPVIVAPTYLMKIHPLASVIGVYANISPAAASMVDTLTGRAEIITSFGECIGAILICGILFSILSVLVLKRQNH